MTTQVLSMTSSRGNAVPNQHVILAADGSRTFQSYGSIIAVISAAGAVTLDAYYWDYSQTTGKYRNKFLGETKAETQRKIDGGTYKLENLN